MREYALLPRFVLINSDCYVWSLTTGRVSGALDPSWSPDAGILTLCEVSQGLPGLMERDCGLDSEVLTSKRTAPFLCYFRTSQSCWYWGVRELDASFGNLWRVGSTYEFFTGLMCEWLHPFSPEDAVFAFISAAAIKFLCLGCQFIPRPLFP